MKKIFILPCFLLLSLIAFTQNEHLKHDNIWLTGYGSWSGSITQGGTVIDFSNDTLVSSYEYRDIDFDISNTTMCDENGELIFSCNIDVIADKLNQVMPNGDGLNPDESIEQDRGRQAVLALPAPQKDSTYYVFHRQLTSVSGGLDGNLGGTFSLLYSIVDMKCCGDNPLGEVVEKNIAILEDTLGNGKLTATRHANGRDWWILQREFKTNNFYKLLITPDSIKIGEEQIIGDSLIGSGGVGYAVFSPDGTKYISLNAFSTFLPSSIDFFDFDRCTGELSNPERIILTPTASGFGGAISPNSRYYYFSFNGGFHQVDLEESPLDTILIEQYDGYASPAPTIPFLGQLGPDGKIYFAAYSSNNILHVIHNPNEAGTACNLEQHGIELATKNNGTIPNHPNYRLGRLIGSPCDTLDWIIDTTTVSNINPEIENFILSPNPAYDFIQFEMEEKADYKISNYAGQVVREGETIFGDNRIDFGVLPSGLYFLTVYGERVRVGKFVVGR